MVRGHNKWFHTHIIHNKIKRILGKVCRERAEKGAEGGNIFEFIYCTTKRFIRIGYTTATF